MEVYSLEAERSVIGCILADASIVKSVREIIKHTDFYERNHQYIFRAIEVIDSDGKEVDLISLSDFLESKGFLDIVGGTSALAEMASLESTGLKAITYANMVADYSARRQIAAAANKIASASVNSDTLSQALDKVREQISKVNGLGGKQNKYQVASMTEYIEGSKERYLSWGKMQGLSTGFPSIDNLTLGLPGGELIIIAGPTSRGKTLLSMSIANNIAKTGKKVLFVTLEMTHEELTSRYMFTNNGWATPTFNTVAANTLFQKNDELDWQDIDGLIQNAKERLGVDLVVIDHLHYFTRELQNAAEDLGRITKEFKKNAIRYNLPIILISHVRKQSKDEELSGESLRGSSLIAQDADIVLLVNRDPETNAMGILIDKNRNRGKLSDRTREWGGRSEREINTVYLDFNNTKLHDPLSIPEQIKAEFPGAVSIPIIK